MTDLTIKICGEAGQGIQTLGGFLAFFCREAGLFLLAMSDFKSRIRGGHTFLQLRISDKPVHAPYHKVHLLVALDEESYGIHREELLPDSLASVNRIETAGAEGVTSVAFDVLADKAGDKITSNTVAAGAVLGILGAPLNLIKGALTDQFLSRGEDVLEKNINAVEIGYAAVKGLAFKWAFDWKKPETANVQIEGSRAVALGALAGDCRLGAFYPMSPSTRRRL